ncbi:hypothetical protein [Streptomyces sp. NBC_00503]|uniref:hypothetical protein n=1 Tax=Streptomyces sp. NBC_00503 TaxID=2903659 RepID=UPI002E82077E|nr:hypothetical protein [Streptomyces sp. NBC_00503]WUD84094.1 hypothetical protein OG490_28050 [Streptomyces sp. NBC_00503]
MALSAGCTRAADAPSSPTPVGSFRRGGQPTAAADTQEQLLVDGATRTHLLHRPGSSVTVPARFGRTSTSLDATDTLLDFFAARTARTGDTGTTTSGGRGR